MKNKLRTDKHTKEQRSKNMRAVKPTGSRLELMLQRALTREGLRYRKNYSKARGKPDIAFVSMKIAVFCDSEFWHGYKWEDRKNEIKSNQEFWWRKIEGNIKRDREITRELEEAGWVVIRFWGEEIKNDLDNCILQINDAISQRRDGPTNHAN